MPSKERLAWDLAESQLYLITLRQLLGLAFTRTQIARRVENRRLWPLYPGVYAVGHPGTTPERDRMAAVLACGEWSGLSLLSAATQWHVWEGPPPLRHHVSTIGRSGRRGARRTGIEEEGVAFAHDRIQVHRPVTLTLEDIVVHRGVRVTSLARTMRDLAGVLKPQALPAVFRQAERVHGFDLALLEASVEDAAATDWRSQRIKRATALLLDDRRSHDGYVAFTDDRRPLTSFGRIGSRPRLRMRPEPPAPPSIGRVARVKICGITRLEDAEFAIEGGAWGLGFILWPGSSRAVDPAVAAGIARRVRRQAKLIGVFVDPTLEEIDRAVEAIGLTHLQLHGDVGPSFCHEARRRTGTEVIRAFRIGSGADLRDTGRFHTDFHLLDARKDDLHGGTGQTWDWDLVTGRRYVAPIIVSGGLTADNVATAIAKTLPFAVDVASGVEAEPGIKDHAKLQAFLEAADAKAAPKGDAVPARGSASHSLQELDALRAEQAREAAAREASRPAPPRREDPAADAGSDAPDPGSDAADPGSDAADPGSEAADPGSAAPGLTPLNAGGPENREL